MMSGIDGGDGMRRGGVMWLLIAVVLVVGVVVLVRSLTDPGAGTGSRGSSAMEILEDRFARGAVDREEFEERGRGLQS